jgi:peptidoglycan/LPS O-acetylase OafA/YrhL
MDAAAPDPVRADLVGPAELAPVAARPDDSGHARLAFIDFLRAVAILLVFIRHSTEVFVPYGHGGRFIYNLGGTFAFGMLGVIVFFGISGFLIPSSLHGPKLAGSVRYLLSRFFRLYPAFAVSVMPSVVSHFWLGGRTLSWHQIALNFTMVPRLFGATLANGAYWTLEVELAFYLICLILFVGGLLREGFCLAAITLVTSMVFQASQQTFFNGLFNPILSGEAFFFNLNVAVLFWGAMLRLWWDGTRLNTATALVCWGFATFWIVWHPACLLVAFVSHHMAGIDTNVISAYGLGMAIFLAAVLHGGLRNPVMLWIGRISYSFYLLHGVVIHASNYELNLHPAWRALDAGLICVVVLLLSLAAAQLSYSLVERPGIRLGRHVIRRAVGWLDRTSLGDSVPARFLLRLVRPLCLRRNAPLLAHPTGTHMPRGRRVVSEPLIEMPPGA